MSRRRSIVILPVIIVWCAALLAQRQQQQSATHADVHVYLTFEDDRPVPQQFRVQLLTGSRTPMTEQLTNDRGEATFYGLGIGSYLLMAAGPGVETGEQSFAVNPHENTHTEYVRLKRKPITGPSSSNEGTVSSATLNIPEKARKEFDKGISAFGKQDFPGARERFTKAIGIYPQYSLAFVNLGVIAMKENKIEEGQKYFERAIQTDPQNASAYTYLARVDIMNRNFSQAETLLTKAIAITPLDPEPLTMLATSELRSGKLDMALTTAKKVHAVPHEHFAVSHLIAAAVLMQEKSPDMAAEEYKLYLKESPESANAASVRAALQSIENRAK